MCFLLLLLFSCQDDIEVDKFEEFYGQYECLRANYHFDFFEGYSTYDTVKILVEKYHPSRSRVLIDDIIIEVDNDGSFNSYHEEPQNPCGCGTTYGNFYVDSIYMRQPDMFCENSLTYWGKKINL